MGWNGMTCQQQHCLFVAIHQTVKVHIGVSEVPFYGGPHPDQIDGHAMLLEVITGDGRPLRPE